MNILNFNFSEILNLKKVEIDETIKDNDFQMLCNLYKNGNYYELKIQLNKIDLSSKPANVLTEINKIKKVTEKDYVGFIAFAAVLTLIITLFVSYS